MLTRSFTAINPAAFETGMAQKVHLRADLVPVFSGLVYDS